MTENFFLQQFSNTSTIVCINEKENYVQLFSTISVFGIEIKKNKMLVEDFVEYIYPDSRENFSQFIDQRLGIKNYNCKKTIISITHPTNGKIDCLLEGIDGNDESNNNIIILKLTNISQLNLSPNTIIQKLEPISNSPTVDNSKSHILHHLNDISIIYTHTKEYHTFVKQTGVILNRIFAPYTHFVFNFDEIETYQDYTLRRELMDGDLSVYRLFEKQQNPNKIDTKLFEDLINYIDLHALILFKEDLLVKKTIEVENEKINDLAHILHDEICQQLASISLLVSKHMYVSDADDNIELQHIKSEINKTIDDIRSISKNLMPKSISDFGFLKSIKAFITELNNESSIKYKFDTSLKDFEYKTKHAIYKLLVDLLRFINSESTANSIEMYLEVHDEILDIKIREKQAKFIMNLNAYEKYNDIKLAILKMKGNIEINSIPQSGIFYNIKIPL